MSKINNLRVNVKAVTAITLAGGIAITAGIIKKSEKYEANTNYQVVIDKVDSKHKNISILNVGDHKSEGKSDLDLIKKANKKNIPVGAIINTTAENQSDILLDAEFARKLIHDYEIDCPIYLDITNLMNNELLGKKEVLKYIYDFCTKLENNHIFVGICGKEDCIQDLLAADSDNIISKYDVLLLDNVRDLNVESEVNSAIKFSIEGNLVTTYDLVTTINEKNLNLKDRLVNDLIYEIQDGETIGEVAEKFGMSAEELLRYNGIDPNKNSKRIKRLTIPVVQSKNTYEPNGELSIGLDISVNQQDVNWDELEKKCNFVIVKASIAHAYHNKDNGDVEIFCAADRYEEHSKNCEDHNIPMGAYSANYISCKYGSIEDFKRFQRKQAENFIATVSNHDLALPAFLDFEDFDDCKNFASNYSAEQIVAMLDIWYDVMTKNGYVPGFYTGQNLYIAARDAYDSYYGSGALTSKFYIWIAGNTDGIKYNSSYTYEDYNNGKIPKTFEFTAEHKNVDDSEVDMTQVSKVGSGFGIIQDVDVDFAKSGYQNANPSEENKIVIKDLERFEENNNFIFGVGGLLVAGAGILLLKKKRIIR